MMLESVLKDWCVIPTRRSKFGWKKVGAETPGFHLSFLIDFIEFSDHCGIKVVISEAQQNPSYNTAVSQKLEGVVRSKLIELDEQYKNLLFVPRSQLVEFQASDFKDINHLKDVSAADEYIGKLLKEIKRSGF